MFLTFEKKFELRQFMGEFCPIVKLQVDEKVVRLNALLTMVLTTVFIISQSSLIALFLTIDFFIRGFNKPKYSPLSSISRIVLNFLKINSVMINSGPKIFAAKAGFILFLSMLIFNVSGLALAACAFGFIVIACASMEFFLNYCVGCKIFGLYNRIVQIAGRR